MDCVNAVINSLLLFYFAAFSWAPPVLGLTVLAALSGGSMLWVIRRTSDRTGMKAAKNRVRAALLQLRVNADAPRATWRAQRSLLAANLNYLAFALRPALWIILPVAILLLHLQAFYGRAPLPVGRETIVTMGMARDWNANSPPPQLSAPPEVRIVGPPVRAVAAREMSWRIEPVRAISGTLTFLVDGQPVRKMIEAGTRQRFIPRRRVSSQLEALRSPDERRILLEQVAWIEIRYPDASLSIFGLRWNWLAWFFVVSVATALCLRKWFWVVF
jgi:uncharacterized membrane protein (DUF106 family)